MVSRRNAVDASMAALRSRRWFLLMSLAALVLSLLQAACSFVPSQTTTRGHSNMLLFNAAKDVEGQINLGLQRAREVLEKSKAKLAAREEAGRATILGADASVPFFAQTSKKDVVSREGVVKSVDEKTGLITADGERMAAISEQEDWEFRPLFEVFENEMTDEEDRYSLASQQLASRDVAASVFNLRKQLQLDDYHKIFDTKNRFIGEDN